MILNLLIPMWFTSLPTIRGWFTGVRLVLGQAGIHIPEFGLAGLTCHSDSALESAGSEVLAGAGDIGDSIGTADIPCMAVAGISRAAPLSTIGQISTGVGEPTERAAGAMEHAAESTERAAEPTRDAGEHKPAGIWPHEAESTIAQARFPDRSMETSRQLEDTRNPVAKRVFAPAPLAALIMEDKQEATRRADSPASVAEAEPTAVAGATAAAGGGVSPNIPG